ncbi:MAG: DUF1673 family protein [Candidatus Methanoperedens sp.]|nr:DUF1673 family protein [Candidatus Methanoperedens sp.]
MIKNVADIIRKTMGWCPNAGALTIRKSMQFDDLTVNAPGSGGELTQPTAGWWNKYRNRVLIVGIIVTYLAINWFFSYGINNMNIFLVGLFTGIAFGILTWAQGLQSLDRIAGSEKPIKTSTKHMIAVHILMILSIVTVGYFASVYGLRTTLAFISGFAFTSWGGYLQIVYSVVS